MATCGYLCVLELGDIFSLIPAQFDQSVNARIAELSQTAAAYSYAVLVLWGTSLCLSRLLKVGTSPWNSLAARRLGNAGILFYCTSAILNDALLHHAEGSALDRMKQGMMHLFSLLWKSTCSLFFCVIIGLIASLFYGLFYCLFYVGRVVMRKIWPRDPWEEMWEEMCREDMRRGMFD